MQEIINEIIDAFPEVHRQNRFSPPEDPLTDEDVEVIYDYTSFTSNLDAVVPFVDGLSHFFRGTTVHTIDPVDGVVARDLGDMFEEYNTVCNLYPRFDISRLGIVREEDALFNHTCGMLGVEGNIFIATLLHGIYLSFLAGPYRSRCVGDDARFHHNTGDGDMSCLEKVYVFWVLAAIGVLNIDKVVVFLRGVDRVLQQFRYIKRPFYRDEDIMMSGLLLALPSQIPITGPLDSFHTVLPTAAHPCRNVFKQIIRYLDTLAVHSVTVSSDEEHETYPIVQHLRYLVRMLKERDKDGKFSECGRSGYRTHYRLPPVEYWGTGSYVDWIVGEIDYYEPVRFPKYGGGDAIYEICDGRAGSVMFRTQSKGRSFLIRMGFLTSEMLYDEFSVAEIGLDFFRILLDGRYSPVMKYTVVRNIPTWYAHVPGTL
jgi:hypothetical protein